MMIPSIKIEGRFQEGGDGGKSSVMMVNDVCVFEFQKKSKGWQYIVINYPPIKEDNYIQGKI